MKTKFSIFLIVETMIVGFIHAGPCNSVNFNDLCSSASKDKCGYTEFINPSTPPKYYLKETVIGSESSFADDYEFPDEYESSPTLTNYLSWTVNFQENFVYAIDRLSGHQTVQSATGSYANNTTYSLEDVGSSLGSDTWTIPDSSTDVWDSVYVVTSTGEGTGYYTNTAIRTGPFGNTGCYCGNIPSCPWFIEYGWVNGSDEEPWLVSPAPCDPQPWTDDYVLDTLIGRVYGYSNTGSYSQTVAQSSFSGSGTVHRWYSPWDISTFKGSGAIVTTLSTEYTDAILRSDMISLIPLYPTNTDGSLAWSGDLKEASSANFHWTDTNHVSCNGEKMKYRLHIRDCVAGETYLVKWDETTSFDNSTNTTIAHLHETVIGNGDMVNGVYTSEHEEPVPSSPCSIAESNPTADTIKSPSTPGGGGASE